MSDAPRSDSLVATTPRKTGRLTDNIGRNSPRWVDAEEYVRQPA